MPAPTITLIYKDADGDEFSFVGSCIRGREAAQRDADELVREFVARGDVRPKGELVFDRFEAGDYIDRTQKPTGCD